MKKSVFIESLKTVFTNVEILKERGGYIEFRISELEYDVVYNDLVLDKETKIIKDGDYYRIIHSTENFYTTLSVNSYSLICGSMNRLEYIKENNKLLFNNPCKSSTETIASENIEKAINHLLIAKKSS